MREFKRLMESRGITVEDVAKACEHKPETVARWLRGEGRGFWFCDAVCIRNDLFPDLTIDKLIVGMTSYDEAI